MPLGLLRRRHGPGPQQHRARRTGPALFLQGIAFDISAVKGAEQRARGQRDEALRLLDLIPQAAIALGAEGEVLCVNAAARELLDLAGELPAQFGPLTDRAFGIAAQAALDLVARTRHMRTPQTGLIKTSTRVLKAHCLPAAEAAGALLLTLES